MMMIMEQCSYGLPALLKQVAEDMKKAQISNVWPLDAQVRAYGLLSALLDSSDAGLDAAGQEIVGFIDTYAEAPERVDEAFDAAVLRDELKSRLAPMEKACNDARFDAAAAASLHEFAKETFHTWQTSGIFMRKRALKALRERAGFRLESHRIGNYVAKTFDLMNEAQMRFASAQQALFAADAAYKIRAGICADIYARLKAR